MIIQNLNTKMIIKFVQKVNATRIHKGNIHISFTLSLQFYVPEHFMQSCVKTAQKQNACYIRNKKEKISVLEPSKGLN